MKLTAETILKGIAIALGTIAGLRAAVDLPRALGDERSAEPSAVVSDDPRRETLQRCRSLTSEALEAGTRCQAAWEENRRRFFGTSTDNSDTE